MAEFKPGDVVHLKSGGPRMTIADIGQYSTVNASGDSAKCIWFEGKDSKEQVFPLHVLKLADERR